MVKTGLKYLAAYGMWIITLLIGLWFCVVSWQGFHKLLLEYYVRESYIYAARASLYEKVFVVIIGFLWALLMIVSEETYRKTALTDQLWIRAAKINGLILIMVFLADALLLLLNGIQNNGWLHWIILVIELVAGLGFTWYARTKKSTK